jgi:hypothetical protein
MVTHIPQLSQDSQMTLPASGQISLSAIQTEFGGSNPISVSEYYRSSGLVPNISQNSGVPTSGQISLSQFYNATKGTIVTLTTAALISGGTGFDALFGSGSVNPTTVQGIAISAIYHLTQSPTTQQILHVEFASNLAIAGVMFTDRNSVLREYLVGAAIQNTGKVYRWDISPVVPFNVGSQYAITIELP